MTLYVASTRTPTGFALEMAGECSTEAWVKIEKRLTRFKLEVYEILKAENEKGT